YRGVERGLALRPQRIGLVGERSRQGALRFHEPTVADGDLPAADFPAHALTGNGLERLHRREAQATAFRTLDNGLGEGVFARALETRDQRKRLVLHDARLDDQVHEPRTA